MEQAEEDRKVIRAEQNDARDVEIEITIGRRRAVAVGGREGVRACQRASERACHRHDGEIGLGLFAVSQRYAIDAAAGGVSPR